MLWPGKYFGAEVLAAKHKGHLGHHQDTDHRAKRQVAPEAVP